MNLRVVPLSLSPAHSNSHWVPLDCRMFDSRILINIIWLWRFYFRQWTTQPHTDKQQINKQLLNIWYLLFACLAHFLWPPGILHEHCLSSFRFVNFSADFRLYFFMRQQPNRQQTERRTKKVELMRDALCCILYGLRTAFWRQPPLMLLHFIGSRAEKMKSLKTNLSLYGNSIINSFGKRVK